MPVIPSMTLNTGDPVSAEELYTNGIFDPKVTPEDFEILNGGLDLDNFGAGNRSVEPRMCQYGSFAMGYFSGFTREDATYARQASADDGTSDTQYVIHSSLSTRIFLPWEPSVLIYGYECLFLQDATKWDTDGTPQTEHWNIRLTRRSGSTIDEKEQCRHVLPWASESVDIPDKTSSMSVTSNLEDRWRYINKHNTEKSVSKGYHEFEVRLYPTIKFPDARIAKVKSVIGGFYALAIR